MALHSYLILFLKKKRHLSTNLAICNEHLEEAEFKETMLD